MFRNPTKTQLCVLAIFLAVLRGILLLFNDTIEWILDGIFAWAILLVFYKWIMVDAEQYGITFQSAKERSKFARVAFFFPFYFRRTRGKMAWRANLLAIGFAALLYLFIVAGGFIADWWVFGRTEVSFASLIS